jgi:hypothetical protein
MVILDSVPFAALPPAAPARTYFQVFTHRERKPDVFTEAN